MIITKLINSSLFDVVAYYTIFMHIILYSYIPLRLQRGCILYYTHTSLLEGLHIILYSYIPLPQGCILYYIHTSLFDAVVYYTIFIHPSLTRWHYYIHTSLFDVVAYYTILFMDTSLFDVVAYCCSCGVLNGVFPNLLILMV